MPARRSKCTSAGCSCGTLSSRLRGRSRRGLGTRAGRELRVVRVGVRVNRVDRRVVMLRFSRGRPVIQAVVGWRRVSASRVGRK